MLRIPCVVVAVCVAGVCLASGATAKERASETLRIGDTLTVRKPVKVSKLAKNPARLEGKTVRLEGIVKEVCQGRGCWVEVSTQKGETFLARSLDHSVLLPTDCKGFAIAVQGVVTRLVKEEPAEHEAEGHVCPNPEWVVSMLGVELVRPK